MNVTMKIGVEVGFQIIYSKDLIVNVTEKPVLELAPYTPIFFSDLPKLVTLKRNDPADELVLPKITDLNQEDTHKISVKNLLPFMTFDSSSGTLVFDQEKITPEEVGSHELLITIEDSTNLASEYTLKIEIEDADPVEEGDGETPDDEASSAGDLAASADKFLAGDDESQEEEISDNKKSEDTEENIVLDDSLVSMMKSSSFFEDDDEED